MKTTKCRNGAWRGIACAAGFVVLGGALHAVLPPPPASATAPVGAPLVCFPIALEDSVRLPFGSAADSTSDEPTVPLAELPRTLAALFAADPDVELHMEALRRASFACSADARGATPAAAATGGAAATRPWAQLLALLESAVVEAELLPESAADRAVRRARAWFDLGYAREVGMTMGLCRLHGLASLEKAAALAPDHRAIRFGAAMAAFQAVRIDETPGIGDHRWCDHLEAALVAPTPQLAGNLLRTFGAFVNVKDLDELRAAVRRERDAR